MKNKKKSYRFTSDVEPDDKELAQIMHEVSLEATKKAKKAMLELENKIKLQVAEAFLQAGIKGK